MSQSPASNRLNPDIYSWAGRVSSADMSRYLRDAPARSESTAQLVIYAGLNVSGFEKAFVNRDDMQRQLVEFVNNTLARLNRSVGSNVFSGPHIDYGDTDYGFLVQVAFNYRGSEALTQADRDWILGEVESAIRENQQMASRLRFVRYG